jgi:hypothetical protein
VGYPTPTIKRSVEMSTRLKGVYTEKAARDLNRKLGEIWIFEHRGMSVWYNGENPKQGWSISDNEDLPGDILWATDFQTSDRLQPQSHIKVGGINLEALHIVDELERTRERIEHYLDDQDIGSTGRVVTDENEYEAELVDVFDMRDDSDISEERYEWIDEITGLICIKPYWDKPRY